MPMSFNIGDLLQGHLFPFLMIFTRLGAGFMMFPGIGEAFVTPRIRMLYALAVTFLLLPVLMPNIPPMPPQIGELAGLIAMEAMVGIFFGSIMRLLMDIVETAGAIIAMETGLSNAMILNPTLASQSALSSAFLSTAAIALLFASGMDHMLLRALLDTYKLFPVGQPLPFGDLLQAFIQILTKSFTVGVQLATPLMVVGLLMYASLGVMQRLMPQVQLFLVIMPAQIMGGFFVFAVTIGAMLTVWLRVYDETVASTFFR